MLSLGYNHTDELMPFQIFLDNQTYNLVQTRSVRVLVDQFVKGVAEGRFKKLTRGSLHFLA